MAVAADFHCDFLIPERFGARFCYNSNELRLFFGVIIHHIPRFVNQRNLSLLIFVNIEFVFIQA